MTEKTMIRVPVCGESEVSQLIEMRDLPVHCNVLWPTREDALNAPRGTIRLALLPCLRPHL